MNWTHLGIWVLRAGRLGTCARTCTFAAAMWAFVLTWLAYSTDASAITLYWVNNSSIADGIIVGRATSVSGPWSNISTVAGSASNYTDSAVTCDIGYFYRVAAYNQAGTSSWSNVAGPATNPCCTYALSANGTNFNSSGGSGTVGVTAVGGCAWTASSNAGWITITGGSSGTGNGTVSYSVAANTSSVGRTGTVTVAGQTFTVIETGVSCTYTLSASSANYSSSGGSGTVGVTAVGGCAWAATSNAGWITITAGSSGTGNGTVSYSVAANASSIALTGTVTVAGQTFTVIAEGETPQVSSPVAITNAVTTVEGIPIVIAGEAVTFSMGASDPPAGSLSYLWDFGDGGTSTDSVPSHVFTDCGTYKVTATVSDGVEATDSELTVSVPCAMLVTNFQAKVNFAKANRDTCKMKVVPPLSQWTNWLGAAVTIDVGGAQAAFTLDAKGRGINTNGTCRVAFNKKTGACVMTANLAGGSWQGAWAEYGLVRTNSAKPGLAVTLPVTLVIDDESFMTEKPLGYTATEKSSGTAK
jgi:hypothetical protein